MAKIYPCPQCKGSGRYTQYELDEDYPKPGALAKMTSIQCVLCEGNRCVWIEPVKEERSIANSAND